MCAGGGVVAAMGASTQQKYANGRSLISIFYYMYTDSVLTGCKTVISV
jgi:hypothetical protein